ncbi:MAG: leucine-rich repeat domain-containing protein [Clostridia bacterium]|nr:leucine-rich repeat domain-containing protein [Clostridia bacterium]
MQIKKITTETYSNLREIIKVKSTIDGFLVDSTNGYFSAVNGILYNKDKTILYAVPDNMTGTLVLPLETKYIFVNAFRNCRINQVIGMGVETIERDAFMKSFISKVQFPSIQLVGAGAFRYCLDLQEVTLSQIVTIHEFAFASSGIQYLKIPSTLNIICKGAFMGCQDLEEVEIEDRTSRLYIKSEVFENCYKLKKFIFSHGMLTLDTKVFKGDSKLEKVILPCVEKISGSAFHKCTSLKKISIESKCKLPKSLQNQSYTIEIRNSDNNKSNK